MLAIYQSAILSLTLCENLVKTINNALSCFNARINKASFLDIEIIKSNLFFKRGIKILFSSKPISRKQLLNRGFRFSRHKISFEELTPENVINYDLVVPLTITDLKFLAKIRHLIPNNPIPIPRLESIELCDDKYLFNQTIIKKGFGDYVPNIDNNLTYPYILKKKIDDWGKNTHIISNKQQEQSFLGKINNPEYFTQQLVTGTSEYATHILFKNGKIVCSISIKHVFEKELFVHGKNEFIYYKICSCPYLALFSSILSAIGFDGLCCIDYKVTDNRPQILEINPRLGGSLSLFFFSFIRHL